MALCTKLGNPFTLSSRLSVCCATLSKRCLAANAPTSTPPGKEWHGKDPTHPGISSEEDGGWLSRLLVRDLDTGHQQHSSRLSDKETVYEMQFHKVKPEFMDQYIKEFRVFMEMISNSQTGAELSASWTVEVGDLDEAIHLWKYDHGYPGLDKHKSIIRSKPEFIEFRRRRNTLLRSRRNQILLGFSFWPEIGPREGPNIYELRSYLLKPGTMIEWGNCWVKGLKTRRDKREAVAGYFSHIGELYQAHHLWGFQNLQDRKEVREAAWGKPGWDECVIRTVPLIKKMQTRILIPMSFSPLQ